MTFGTEKGWAMTVIGGKRLTISVHHYRRARYRTKTIGRIGLIWPTKGG